MKTAVIGIMMLFAAAAGFMAAIDQKLYPAIIALVFLAGAVGVLREKLTGYYAALLPIILALLFYLRRMIYRASFVIREGGLERRDGYGSPLAFLFGVFFELFGLALVCGFGAWIIGRIRQLGRGRSKSPVAGNGGNGGEPLMPGE